jgi:hypothetical protein
MSLRKLPGMAKDVSYAKKIITGLKLISTTTTRKAPRSGFAMLTARRLGSLAISRATAAASRHF